MKKILLCLGLMLSVGLANASESLYVQRVVDLRQSADDSSTSLGFLMHGAAVTVLATDATGWARVRVDNGTEGFVPQSVLDGRLFGVSDAESFRAPVIGSDDDYGSAHLHVLVAGLKARRSPTDSRVAKRLAMGEAVSVRFYPSGEGDWVNIASDSEGMFVQRQFLGAKPDLQKVLASYDALPQGDVAARRLWSERAVELAWTLNQPESAIKALERFISVARDLNDSTLIENAELDLLLARSLAAKRPYDELEKALTDKKRFHVVISGELVSDTGLKLKNLMNVFGQPSKVEKIQDECGVYMGDRFYHFAGNIFDVDSSKGRAWVDTLSFSDKNVAYVFNGERLDNRTGERDFLMKAKGFIDANPVSEPHVYYVSLEGGSERFVFKNGFLSAYHYQSMC